MAILTATRSDWADHALGFFRIVAGIVFISIGTMKVFGYPPSPAPVALWSQMGIGGLIEVVGGVLIVLGLFTRPVAFILSGEMAVAYFRSWAPRGFFPIANGGEEATLFAFLFLWLWTAGAGAWSLDGWWRGRTPRRASLVARWEPQARALLRMVMGFLLVLHGCRKLFGVLVSVAGRRNAPPLAIDALPPFTGYVDLIAGVLLMMGLFVRQTAAVVATEALLAYALFAQPRTLWPIRNGGNEALLYVVLGILFVVAGSRAWSVDAWRLDKSSSESDVHNYSERRRLRA